MNTSTWIGVGLILTVYLIIIFCIYLYKNQIEKTENLFSNKYMNTETDFANKYKQNNKGKLVLFEILYFILFVGFAFIIAYIWGSIMVKLYYYGLSRNEIYTFIVGTNLSLWFIEGLFIGILLSFVSTEIIIKVIFKGNYLEMQIYKMLYGGILGTVKGLRILSTTIIFCSIIYTIVFMNSYIRINESVIEVKDIISFTDQRNSYTQVDSLYKIYAKDKQGKVNISYEIIFANNTSVNSKNFLIDDNIQEKLWGYISIKTNKKIQVLNVNTNKFRSIKDLNISDN